MIRPSMAAVVLSGWGISTSTSGCRGGGSELNGGDSRRSYGPARHGRPPFCLGSSARGKGPVAKATGRARADGTSGRRIFFFFELARFSLFTKFCISISISIS